MPERNVLPKPYTKPHPPIWVACGSPSTFEKAGRLGLGALCFSLGTPADFAPLIKVYKDAIKHAEPVGDYVNDNVACVTALVCHENGKVAREIALDMGSGYHTESGVPVPRHLSAARRRARVAEADPRADARAARGAHRHRAAHRRRPGRVRASAVQQYADVGCDQIIFGVLASTQPQEVALGPVRAVRAQRHPALRQGSGAQHDAPAMRPRRRRGRG